MSEKAGRLARFRWSHQGNLHRGIVRAGNRLLALVPSRLQYAVGTWRRRHRPPYSLVPGRVCVQVGAPADTLHAGRSRGFYFSLLAGEHGRVLVVEPDPISAAAFEDAVRAAGTGNAVICNHAAWDRCGTIELMVDARHRATSFVAGLVPYDSRRLDDFTPLSVPAAPLDDILEQQGFVGAELISITTNWAEPRILAGMNQALDRASFVCLAYGPHLEECGARLGERGFEHYAHDDRGVTFAKVLTSSHRDGSGCRTPDAAG